MKYLFVSDIHGEYDKLMAALEPYDITDRNVTIVVLGDAFDRGPNSKDVLDFCLRSNVICVWGNHDLRLADLYWGKAIFNDIDKRNGVAQTFRSFLHSGSPLQFRLVQFSTPEDETYALKLRLELYFAKCVYGLEFSNLIATHGWLPYTETALLDYHHASPQEWQDATWANTEKCIEAKLFPSKTLLVGHWHAWRIAEKIGGILRTKVGDISHIDTSTYKDPDNRFICIDGCTNWNAGGKVNVYCYETNEIPYPLVADRRC